MRVRLPPAPLAKTSNAASISTFLSFQVPHMAVYEAGKVPLVKGLMLLCKKYDITFDYLLFGKETVEKEEDYSISAVSEPVYSNPHDREMIEQLRREINTTRAYNAKMEEMNELLTARVREIEEKLKACDSNLGNVNTIKP